MLAEIRPAFSEDDLYKYLDGASGAEVFDNGPVRLEDFRLTKVDTDVYAEWMYIS